jgi:pimeloyl-ACP methyl ester carboxylesterase
MNTITTKDKTEMYYKNWGSGQPVVFSHGRPLNADARENQMLYLASNGYRCIAHDRPDRRLGSRRVQTCYQCDLEGLPRRPSWLALDARG